MKISFPLSMAIAIAIVLGVALALTFQTPPVQTAQNGYRGTGMLQVVSPRAAEARIAANKAPEASPPQDKAGKPASAEYANVQVLKDVDANDFMRLMADITAWVSPEQGCAYCHAEGEELSSDKLYTKVVSRRMIEMTRHINATWKPHVADTGVTCFTCHRGQPVPASIWFADNGPPQARGMAGSRAGQNIASANVGYTSLPHDPFSPFLVGEGQKVRVVSTTALPSGNASTIKDAEATYGAMVHMSAALGVNCTYCHNTRSFAAWDQSSPQRVTALQGLRMVRDLNAAYLEPLKTQLPPVRHGPLGDGPKLNCATCHQGVSKPLLGASILKDYPELAGPR